MKDFKIYTHNLHSLKVKAFEPAYKSDSAFKKLYNFLFGLCYYVGVAILSTISFFGRSIFNICFHTGNTIWKTGRATIRGSLAEITKTRFYWIKRFKLLLQKSFAHGLLTFIFLAALGWGAFAGLHLIAKGLNLKDQVVGSTLLGKYYLNQAKDALSEQDITTAQNKFHQATLSFQHGQEQLNSVGKALNTLLNLVPQKRDGQKLLEAATAISSAGSTALDFYQQMNSVKITAAGLESQEGNAQTINAIS